MSEANELFAIGLRLVDESNFQEEHMHTTHVRKPAATWVGGLAADDHGHDDHRPPLVLLHGMTFDRSIWRPIVAHLERIDPGRRVLAIDLPGHGQSPDQPSYELDEVPDQLNRVVQEAGLAAPVIVGHSAGGLAATMYAARHPTCGVINVDQPLDVAPFAEFVRSLSDRLRGPEFPAVWQMFYESFHTDFLPADAQELVRSTCRPRQQVVLGYWHQILDLPVARLTGLISDATAALRTAGVPYVHIAGGEPAPEYRQWLGEQLPAAAIEVWPRSGHFPHLARPQQFAQQLAATAQWARNNPTPLEPA
jgi:pimeloyl-ACP methyl ester carboxylesterase